MRNPLAIRIFAQSIIVGVAMCSSGCRQTLPPDEYKAWIQDTSHGLHAIKTIGAFVFDVQFQPEELLRLEQPIRDSAGRQTELETDMQYYTLKISYIDPSKDIIRHGAADAREYQQQLYYYSFLFQNDLHLEEKGTTYPCVLFHFEQSDLANQRTFILGFETPKDVADNTRLVIGSDRFGSLPVKIEIVKDKIPALKV